MKLITTMKETKNKNLINNSLINLIQTIETLDWNVTIYEDDNCIYLQRFSPAGQDFEFSIDIDNNIDTFVNNIYNYYDNFDVSYETYLWLDDSGHGKNGAPYDMKDIYNDMEECKNLIFDLYEFLKNKYLDI